MKVFVVLSNAMGGVRSSGVYRTRDAADLRASENIFGTDVRTIDFEVIGIQSDPNVVYIAQTYDRIMDIHNFEGVYGNYDDASRASGSKGQPLSCSL